METKNKKVIDLEIVDELQDSGVSMIALVDVPAIEKDWMAFKKEVFVNPSKGETQDEFIPRCAEKLIGEEGYDQDQALAICYSTWREEHAKQQPFYMNDAFLWPDGQFEFEESPSYKFAKISLDYDDTLSTGLGLRLAQRLKEEGNELYIISARNTISKGMLRRAEELGISTDRVFATGSNEAKVNKIKELGIEKHVDNNLDVVKELGPIGQKFSFAADTYTDYPEAAKNAAQRALDWAEKNGWGSCGTPIGKARANQLAKGEPISEETISRMASFYRHKQNSDTPYGEGCGKLMWDAWGSDAGIAWAQKKLEQIRRQEMSYDVSALPSYTDQTGLQPKKRVKLGQYDYVVDPMDNTTFQTSAVTLDVPLFLRLLEIARENLNDDDQLHSLVEKAAEISSEGKILTMDDLGIITSSLPMEMQELPAPAFPTTESSAPAESPIEKLGYPSIVSLPRGHTIIIQAEGDTPPHGLLVQFMETGGYDVKYWWNNTKNIVPSQVNIDGAQVADQAMSVHLGFHGSMPYGQAFAASGKPGDRPLARIPKEERGRTGSAKNEPGDTKTSRGGVEVSAEVEKTLKDKIEEHNKKNTQDSQKADLGMLKAVWRRGAGAYSVGTPGKRNMTRAQWAMARVNSFLNILAGNKSGYDKDFTQDNDLLPKGHPKHSKEKMSKMYFASEDQKVIVGPVAIPNIEIVRKDEETKKPYWVKFSPEVIRKMSEKFMRELRNHDTNIMHEPKESAGTYVMESWVVENDQDKANSLYDFNVPVGTWMVKMRVTDPQVWKMVKAGKLNGFSLEGNFMDRQDYEAYKKDKELYNRVMRILKST